MNIVIMGVGGQGSLLASQLLGELFIRQGLDVKVSEVHGMSQRGGSVITMMRSAKKVYSPLVDPGTADLLIGLEVIETLRGLPFLSKNGKIVATTQIVWPVSAKKDREYGVPEENGAVILDAVELSRRAGNEKTANVAVLGAVSAVMGYDEKAWHEALGATVKPEMLDVNLKAFTLGKQEAMIRQG
ncbi:MAG: indolepyruvate oxidoreductase subunit beta [Oscillospiraceae bacterium]|nr:indolepyruvate oxidoreductase subunit beta [Oscillospiraceae bacterium]